MDVIEKIPTKGAELKVGDITLGRSVFVGKDVYARIISITEPNYDETAITVEDGYGYTYMIRIGLDTEYFVYPWEEGQWEHYRNGL